jgi:hypothetical protein
MAMDDLKLLPKETTYDRIYTWYVKGDTFITLTETEIEIRERWQKCWLLLCNGRTPEKVVRFMNRICGIGRSQAYTDIRNASKLFGEVVKTSKDSKRALYEGFANKIYQMALHKNPPDLDNANKALKNMIDLSGLNESDPDLPDFSKLEPSQFIINLPPEIQNYLMLLIQKGAINLTQFRDESKKTIDVQHTEINTDEPGK